jgi:ankyrin repeat protein
VATSPLVAAVRTRDLRSLTRLLATHLGPIPAQAIVEAGRLGWQPGLALLEKRGADLNASFKNYRALHALIQEQPHAGGSSTPKRVACLRWLLKHGADPELPAAWPAARAIVIAAFVGDQSYVDALSSGAATTNIFSASALGDTRTVRTLLTRDSALALSRDAGLLTALHCCGGSRLGQKDARSAARLVEIARQLVAAGADVNAKTRTWGHDVDVAYFVIRSGQIETLTLLLGQGLDATAAIGTAAWENREEVVDLLLEHGAQIDRAVDHAKPVLNELVRWGQLKQARMLLKKGASPNVPDAEGWTSIHQAVSRGNVKMLRDLMAAGGDAERRDRSGRTPRAMARASPRKDLLAFLT